MGTNGSRIPEARDGNEQSLRQPQSESLPTDKPEVKEEIPGQKHVNSNVINNYRCISLMYKLH